MASRRDSSGEARFQPAEEGAASVPRDLAVSSAQRSGALRELSSGAPVTVVPNLLSASRHSSS
jgi:hypothetical protein